METCLGTMGIINIGLLFLIIMFTYFERLSLGIIFGLICGGMASIENGTEGFIIGFIVGMVLGLLARPDKTH